MLESWSFKNSAFTFPLLRSLQRRKILLRPWVMQLAFALCSWVRFNTIIQIITTERKVTLSMLFSFFFGTPWVKEKETFTLSVRLKQRAPPPSCLLQQEIRACLWLQLVLDLAVHMFTCHQVSSSSDCKHWSVFRISINIEHLITLCYPFINRLRGPLPRWSRIEASTIVIKTYFC